MKYTIVKGIPRTRYERSCAFVSDIRVAPNGEKIKDLGRIKNSLFIKTKSAVYRVRFRSGKCVLEEC